jgi:hypothetical protein
MEAHHEQVIEEEPLQAGRTYGQPLLKEQVVEEEPLVPNRARAVESHAWRPAEARRSSNLDNGGGA